VRPPRSDVLWFGAPADDEVARETRQRDLRLVPGEDAGECAAFFARAAVFAAAPGREDELAEAIAANGPRFLDLGLDLQGTAEDDASLERLLDHLRDRGFPLDAITMRSAPEAYRLAEDAARHQPGDAPNGLAVAMPMLRKGEPPSPQDILLLSRAFANCSELSLLSLAGGLSDARVFAVYASLLGSYPGVRSQPLFAKIDRIDKIVREFENYRNFATPYIPFGLRPNVREIVKGNGRAVLVGDFVDKSEPLGELVRREVAAGAIDALFNETLAGWTDQAYARDPEVGSVARALERSFVCRPTDFKSDYATMLERSAPPMNVWSSLTAVTGSFRTGPAHGDLHAENVRVRSGRAILIDLASVCPAAPITTDVASLEIALAFEPHPETKPSEFADPAWRAEVERLYRTEAFVHAPGPSVTDEGLSWMTGAVRQLRRIGLATQSAPGEYRTVVASLLLRRCQWMGLTACDRYRRAVGYLIAASLAEAKGI